MEDSPLFSRLPNNNLGCLCCAHYCIIPPGKLGKCRARANVNGSPHFPAWGRYTLAVDPVEKKPLYHFLPGTSIFSYGTVGCNFSCQFCQNSSLSMWKLDIEDVGLLKENDVGRLKKVTPEQVVKAAIDNKCLSIASTYNEPTVTTEFSYQVFKLAKEKGLRTVYVTNGYESIECLEYLAPYLDAVNIDLKSFSDDFYLKICGAHLQPVCDTIRRCYAMGIHTEVTTLVIPKNNDSNEELKQTAEFLASVGVDIPWHVSAYHDDYMFEGLGHTPLSTLKRAAEIGKRAGLLYIYIGNAQSPEERITKCPKCGEVLIDRVWFGATIRMKKGCCVKCGERIPGLFSDADHMNEKLIKIPQDLRTSVFVQEPSKMEIPSDVVIYASNGGTAKRYAEMISSILSYPAIDIMSVDLKQMRKCKRIIFVVATYGKGSPPPSAQMFWEMLKDESSDQLKGIKFAVMGCGSSSFPSSFCAFAHSLQERLAELGASSVTDLYERDEDNSDEGGLQSWMNSLNFQ